MNNDYAIEVRNLKKKFGEKQAVNDVSMKVAKGEIFGFLGPNGSGKTTTIRMMCGLLTPDSGEGTCLGYDIIKESAQIKRHVGYMTQQFSMWKDLTIRENLEFVAKMYDMDNRADRVNHALKHLKLEKQSSELAGALSGGWKQRMALAACMLHDPKLLLLDEPTGGFDPKARRDFWEELHGLAAKGIAVLVTTHYMDEAERCHKLAYIFNGQLLAQGTPDQVIQSQGIYTFAVQGDDLMALSDELRRKPGVSQTIIFSSALHVSGDDKNALIAALSGIQNITVQPIETSLEDVFIHLMQSKAKEKE